MKLKEFIPREIEKDIVRWLDAKEILVIRGPRQSGKTTLLYRITEILEKKIDKKRIHFISLEDDLEKEKFEKNPREYIDYYKITDKKHFFLFDEMQYVKDAGKMLKLLYDSIENIKIIITGSSTLDINEIGSYLVGRALFFELYPLSFLEFLSTKDSKINNYYKKHKFYLKSRAVTEVLFLDKINPYLKEFLIYGGYPRVVLEKDKEKKKFLLKNIFLTYIEKDIVKLYGTKYKQRISDLIKYLASINSCILNYNEACNTASLYYKELKELLGMLENTYVIKIIKPFHKNLVSELRKNPKIYFLDTGLRNFIVNRFDFSDEEFGRILENYVLNRFKEGKINYWRTTAKAEVDFILNDNLPIEVKIKPKITRSLRSFIETYKPETGLLINMDSSYRTKVKNTNIFIIPAGLI